MPRRLQRLEVECCGGADAATLPALRTITVNCHDALGGARPSAAATTTPSLTTPLPHTHLRRPSPSPHPEESRTVTLTPSDARTSSPQRIDRAAVHTLCSDILSRFMSDATVAHAVNPNKVVKKKT
jgi:hypothetical protein